ncbi:MAG: IspD/TarI family cytidylyltransferase [Actinomycetota bacterium]|jgi:2-C-methyl-D-erythritol 4-phosphate cytidylyltransferase|nr:IspD/TarI family cytidylyltransferase [Actinomycetota bacterium]
MRTVAVVLAGGTGLRIGGDLPKQLQLLGGKTLLERSVAAFDSAPGVSEVVVVMAAPFLAEARRMLFGRYAKVSHVIAGGADRPDSTSRAIDLLTRTCEPGALAGAAGAGGADQADCNVLFHDAARPLVDQRIIADCVAALAECEALGVVVPTADTIVRLADDRMVSIPPREELGRCQTPQAFRLSVIRRAYELAAADRAAGRLRATDDCGMVLRYLPEVEVRAIAGSERNMKITYPADLRIAESLLMNEP